MKDQCSGRARPWPVRALRVVPALAVGLSLVLGGADSQALVHSLPPNLAPEILSETVPFTFIPADFEAADYAVEWQGGSAIPGVSLKLGSRSLEWVRVSGLFDLPRAELLVEADDVETGTIEYLGFTQAMVIRGKEASAKVPVAMISGEKVPVTVRIKRAGKLIERKAEIRFRPRQEHRGRAVFDPTCSPYRLRVETVGAQAAGASDDWIYVGCRLVYMQGAEYPRASFEAYVFWDNVGQTIEVNGVPTEASSVSVWPLRLRHSPGQVRLRSKTGREVILHYSVPDRTRAASLGIGIGPYNYSFNGLGKSSNTIAPLVTWYGSYFLDEARRFVAFSAMPIHKDFYAELGLYFWNQQIRTFDDRFSMNVLLGAHVTGFRGKGKTYVKFGGPQGIELTFRDFLKRRHNVTFGGFFFPRINNQAYYNSWLRWGVPERFFEFNYLAWLEPADKELVYVRSFGICVGFPLASFF